MKIFTLQGVTPALWWVHSFSRYYYCDDHESLLSNRNLYLCVLDRNFGQGTSFHELAVEKLPTSLMEEENSDNYNIYSMGRKQAPYCFYLLAQDSWAGPIIGICLLSVTPMQCRKPNFEKPSISVRRKFRYYCQRQ